MDTSRSAERHRPRSTSAGRRRISPRSRLLAAGGPKAQWIHRFVSNTPTRSGCFRCSLYCKSGLKGLHKARRGIKWLEVCAQGRQDERKPLVSARQTAPQFPLRPHSGRYRPTSGGRQFLRGVRAAVSRTLFLALLNARVPEPPNDLRHGWSLPVHEDPNPVDLRSQPDTRRDRNDHQKER